MKRPILAILTAATLAAASVCIAQAQNAPAAPAAPGAAAPGAPAAGRGNRGGAGRGGARAPIVQGPAAPVPPEVAISRPTVEEIAAMNAELKRLAAADASPTSALLGKYESLLMVTPPRFNVAASYTPSQVRNVGGRHAGFVARAQQGDIDVMFEGDSITDGWTGTGPIAYKKYFGDMKVANFGIGSDTLQGVLWGLHNGEGQGSPKAVMMMIGTNNIGQNTPEEIAEGIGAIVLENRHDFPNAKILLMAVFPRGLANDANRARIAQINKSISKLDDHQHVFYMDIGAKFLDPATGEFLPNAFKTDNLHPQEKGYDIWGSAVRDVLLGFMK